MPNAKSLQIFRPGRHTALSGAVLEFSEADVAAAAAAYDPDLSEAPLVVGHPQLDAPAYGWVEGLAFASGVLEATPRQVEPTFADMVTEGRFKKISASFYPPNSPNNPKPGVYYLKHVGFLGAAAPAVKGLRSAEFAADDDAVELVADFAEAEDSLIARIVRGLRDLLGEQDAPVFATPHADTHPTKEEPMPEQNTNTALAEEVARRAADVEARERAIAERETQFAERERTIDEKEAAQRRTELTGFVDGLVEQGRVLPKDRDGLIAFAELVAPEQAIAFGEGDNKTETGGLTWFKDWLAALPEQVDYSEHTPPEEEQAAAAEFSAPAGASVDASRLALHRKALAYQQKNPGTEYLAAVKAVGG